jgi:hypothetical protein
MNDGVDVTSYRLISRAVKIFKSQARDFAGVDLGRMQAIQLSERESKPLLYSYALMPSCPHALMRGFADDHD